MPTVQLTTGARRGKYGLVRVLNPDGSFNREYKITGEELAAKHANPNASPPGLTRQEWQAYRVIRTHAGGGEDRQPLCTLDGIDYEVGDVAPKGDGLRIVFAEDIIDGHFVESVLRLEPGEWTGTLPNISVASNVLRAIRDNADPETRRVRGRTVVSIENGVLTWQ